MSDVEILDLVNEDDIVIDTLPRDEIYAKNLQYVRAVDAFIKNDKGELWIPIRTADKHIAPNGYDIGVGGHVEHGESYEEALEKEVKEELDWDLKSLTYKLVGKFGPKDGLNTVSMVYEISSNVDPILNPADFTSAEWIHPKELAGRIRDGHEAKSNLAPLLRLVYGNQL